VLRGVYRNTMDAVSYRELTSLPPTIDALEAESVRTGFGMVARLRSGWESGANRFQGDGEILVGAFRGGRLIGTAGLNRDPYVDDASVGRIRHVYVLERERRRGVARALVERLLAHAAGRFRVVRLSTGEAASFYESLGFARVEGEHVTHVMVLE
jgi:GNAT superfamily N-acetyltransferase